MIISMTILLVLAMVLLIASQSKKTNLIDANPTISDYKSIGYESTQIIYRIIYQKNLKEQT